MAEVVIYTKPWCPYCRRARALLERKGVDYEEIDIRHRPELEREMIDRARGRTTVPQVFIDGKHVGGCDDLHELERRGHLDELLGTAKEA